MYDEDFYPNEQYADILVSEIPPKRYIDTFIVLYKRRQEASGENLSFVFNSLVKKIGEDKLGEVIDVITDDLRSVTASRSLTHFFRCFPSKLWPKIAIDARLRVENKLLLSVKKGTIEKVFETDADSSRVKYVVDEALGTWISSVADYLTPEHKIKFHEMVYEKVLKDASHCAYVISYFLKYLPDLEANIPYLSEYEPDFIKDTAKRLYKHYHSYSPDVKSTLDGSFWLPDNWEKAFVAERMKIRDDDDISPEDIPF